MRFEYPRLKPAVVIGLVFAMCLGRLLYLVHHYGLHVLFYDEWDYLVWMWFDRSHTFWQTFNVQYGPMRMGIGLNMVEGLLRRSHWDSHALGYLNVGIASVACMVALYLKKRLFGKFEFEDILIPVVVLSLSQSSLFFIVRNPCHGLLPLLFLLCMALAMTSRNFPFQWAVLIAFNFLMLFSQAGLLMGVITPVALTVLISRKKFNSHQKIGWLVMTWVFCGASIGLFMCGYVFNSATSTFQWTIQEPLQAARFLGILMEFSFWGVVGAPAMYLFLSLILFVLAIGLHWRRQSDRHPLPDSAGVIGLCFVSFSILCAASITLGRYELGADAALVSRYHPYFIPLVLALYGLLVAMRSDRFIRLMTILFVGTFLAAEIRNDARQREKIQLFSRLETQWLDCYQKNQNITFCNDRIHFELYPKMTKDFLDKFAYLKANALNLFHS